MKSWHVRSILIAALILVIFILVLVGKIKNSPNINEIKTNAKEIKIKKQSEPDYDININEN